MYKLLHVFPHVAMLQAVDWKLAYFTLASPPLAAHVYGLAFRGSQQRMQQLAVAAQGQPALSSLVGMVFEQRGHAEVPAGVTVQMRKLQRPRQLKRALPQHSDSRTVRQQTSTAPGAQAVLAQVSTAAFSHHYLGVPAVAAAAPVVPVAPVASANEVHQPHAHSRQLGPLAAGAAGITTQLTSFQMAGPEQVQLAAVHHKWDDGLLIT